LKYPFWLARGLLDLGEALIRARRVEQARPMLTEAIALFEQLAATPWLIRAGDAVDAAAALPAGEPVS
jgi:hypothetical protein